MKSLIFLVLLGLAALVCADLQEDREIDEALRMLHSRNKRGVEFCRHSRPCSKPNQCCSRIFHYCRNKHSKGEDCNTFLHGCGCLDGLECKPYKTNFLGTFRRCVAKPTPPPPTEPAGSGDGF